ncbi:hypothetical protein WG909_07675 [Peptostreptococcaceae bacterium AGR-M142]
MDYKYKDSKIKFLGGESFKIMSILFLGWLLLFILALYIGNQIDREYTIELLKSRKLKMIVCLIPLGLHLKITAIIRAIEDANKKLKKGDISNALVKLKDDVELDIEKKFKYANSNSQKDKKNKYKFAYLETKFRCYFELVKTQYTKEAKENLDKTFGEIIALLEIMNEKEEQAYLYYNKGIASEIIYNTNRSNEYKIEAQNNYQKSIELSKNQEFINQANKRLNNI